MVNTDSETSESVTLFYMTLLQPSSGYYWTGKGYSAVSDDKYLSNKVLKYILKHAIGTWTLVLEHFLKLVLDTSTQV